MRKLTVLERDLLFALTNQMQDTAHYLDLETGEVIPVFSFNRDQILAKIKEHPSRFIRLVAQPKRLGRDMMQRFIETVRKPELKAQLIAALKERRPFSRFRAVLQDYPREFQRWQNFRTLFITANLRERLFRQGINLEVVPEPPGPLPYEPHIEEEGDEED